MTKKKTREPQQLIRGKKFHKLVQQEWHEEAEGTISTEKPLIKPGGSRGRLDIYVEAEMVEDKYDGSAMVEIKSSDWDAMTLRAVRRNVRRHIRQFWNYVDSRFIQSEIERNTGVSIGIIYDKRPKDPERQALIEKIYDEEHIPVVWHDETIEEAKARNQSKD